MREIPIEHRGDIVIAHWPPHPTAEGVHVFFDEMEALLQVRPRAVVLDALAVESAPIAVRNAAGRRLKVMAGLLRDHLRGQATVLGSPLIRGALATVHFFAPPKYPVATFATVQEAIHWAGEQLRVGVAE